MEGFKVISTGTVKNRKSAHEDTHVVLELKWSILTPCRVLFRKKLELSVLIFYISVSRLFAQEPLKTKNQICTHFMGKSMLSQLGKFRILVNIRNFF